MRFIVDRIAFRDALLRVEMAIDRKPTNPLYGGVLIEAANRGVVLTTNDLDLAVRYRVDAVQVEQPGWAVIPGPELVDIVRDVEAETITLDLKEGGQCELICGDDRCTLVTIESSARPSKGAKGEPERGFVGAPELPAAPDLVLAKEDFLLMVQSTRFATSRVQDTRFATEGVLIELRDGEVTLVGTDGRRLACIRRPAAGGASKKQRVVLLPKVLDQILRHGQDESAEEVEIWFLGNQVGFRLGSLESFGRVLAGEYPNYDNVIPKSGKHVVRAHREPFTQKLRLASHLTQDSAAVVRLAFTPNNLEVAAEHEGRGRASANFEVDYVGEGLKTAFNPGSLLDGLKAAHSEQIEMQLDESSRPVKMVLGENFSYVVMPLSTLG
jgi:DNA polymerase-3 subunit beta